MTPKLNRDVAIKVLPTAFSSDPERLRRFEQEAQSAGALNHPNIITIYDVDIHNDSPYVVSELLEGETLRQQMGGTALTRRKALDYALQLAHGLADAHGRELAADSPSALTSGVVPRGSPVEKRKCHPVYG